MLAESKEIIVDMDEIKRFALSQYLEVDIEEIDEFSGNFSYGSQEYSVFTDEEADLAATEYIQDSLWAFNADFIASETGIPGAEKLIRAAQESMCEDLNESILAMVNGTCGLESFAESAISADGRGNFLAFYDSEENEVEYKDPEASIDLFIYRIN